MRRFVYCTTKVKHPKYFANMSNIVGTEQVFPVEFEDYLEEKYGLESSDLSDEEFDTYFEEYRESLESTAAEATVTEDSVAECAVDMDLDATINMKIDGSWDFADNSWSVCADTSDGSWMSSDDRLIATSDQLVSDTSALLQLYLPIEEGTFNITGDIHLVYDMSDEDAVFDIAHSTVENFFFNSAETQGDVDNEI